MLDHCDILDPALEQELISLRFLPIGPFEGKISGLHFSPQSGASIEFAEHKEYSFGDDPRHINWKAFARLDRLYVKVFERETNTAGYLLVDCSASMLLKSKFATFTKLEFAAKLAAAITFVWLRQGDAAGLIPISSPHPLLYVPARSRPSHLKTVLSALAEYIASAESNPIGQAGLDVADAIQLLSVLKHSRGTVVMISDLLVHPDLLWSRLAALKAKGNWVSIMHILDPAEYDDSARGRTFPFLSLSQFVCPETGKKLLADARLVRGEYIKRMQQFVTSCKSKAAEIGIPYTLANTDKDIAHLLRTSLGGRK